MPSYDEIFNVFLEEVIDKHTYYSSRNHTDIDIVDVIYNDIEEIVSDMLDECKHNVIFEDECGNPYILDSAYVSRDGKIYFSLKHIGEELLCDAEEYIEFHPYDFQKYIKDAIYDYFYESNIIDTFLDETGLYEELKNMSEENISEFFKENSDELFNKFKNFLLETIREVVLNYIEEDDVIPGIELMTFDRLQECIMKINFNN